MRIVIDAMGADARPTPDVAGAFQYAAQHPQDEVILVGPSGIIAAEIDKQQLNAHNVTIVDAAEVIPMSASPTSAARELPQSSMHVGMGLVADKQADAFVSAGNTGAALAIATLHTLKRIAEVKRPALAATYPRPQGFTVGADAGANADSRPEHLLQFGLMASLYAEHVLKIGTPKIGLLSNGEEEGKGSELVKETAALLASTAGLNYVGNVEPYDVFNEPTCDVVVHDGFTGNIMLKSAEATFALINTVLREEIQGNAVTTMGGMLARPALRGLRRRLDPSRIGGAALLGVRGPVIIAHGGSNAEAVYFAMVQARAVAAANLVQIITDQMPSLSSAAHQ